MTLSRHKERAEAVERALDDLLMTTDCKVAELVAEQLAHLADVVADLCDDLTTSSPNLQDNLQDEWRRGSWVKEASRWYLLVEQDDDEIWWAVRFDVVGIASPKLCTLMPNSPDYQRCDAPKWWNV